MMCYRKREVEKGLFRGDPAERTDREIVILSLASGELCSKVGEGKELVGSIGCRLPFGLVSSTQP